LFLKGRKRWNDTEKVDFFLKGSKIRLSRLLGSVAEAGKWPDVWGVASRDSNCYALTGLGQESVEQ
jgi:hypothetical protein